MWFGWDAIAKADLSKGVRPKKLPANTRTLGSQVKPTAPVPSGAQAPSAMQTPTPNAAPAGSTTQTPNTQAPQATATPGPVKPDDKLSSRGAPASDRESYSERQADLSPNDKERWWSLQEVNDAQHAKGDGDITTSIDRLDRATPFRVRTV